MSIHFSKMTGKLKGIPAINTNTVTNEFCIKMNKSDAICKSCYSMNMLNGSRKNCQPAFERNSVLLSQVILEDSEIPIINAAFFRFHGHGELINTKHMINFHNIALKNPHCNFALWTKRRDIIRNYKKDYKVPDNLILIYSNPTVNVVRLTPPEGFDKVFNVVEKDQHQDIQNCTGQNCIDCLTCYKNNGESVITEAIKKRS